MNPNEKATPAQASQNFLNPLPEFRKKLGGISAATLYRWEKEQRVKLVRIGGRTFGPKSEVVRLTSFPA